MLYRDFEDDSDRVRKVPSEQTFAELQVPNCRQVSTVGNLRSTNLNGENDRNMSCLTAVLPHLDAEMSTSPIPVSPQMLSSFNSPAFAYSAPFCHFKSSKRETDNTSVVASVISRSVRADINALLSSEIECAKIGPPIPLSEQAIYVVSFKRSTRDFTLHTRVPTVINNGDTVVVSAERGGMDLGTVCTIITMGEYMSTRFHGLDITAPPPPGMSKFNIKKHTCKLVRIATAREQRMLAMKELDEQKVLQSCTHILHTKYHLPLTLVDAEYQFDRHKITLYYRPLGRLDFKQFVDEVSAVHNTRAWMEAVV